jgi:hypothetical protein
LRFIENVMGKPYCENSSTVKCENLVIPVYVNTKKKKRQLLLVVGLVCNLFSKSANKNTSELASGSSHRGTSQRYVTQTLVQAASGVFV